MIPTLIPFNDKTVYYCSYFFSKKKINLSTVIECPKFTIYDRYRDVVTTFFQKAKRQKRVRYLSLTEMSKEPPTKCHGRCDS